MRQYEEYLSRLASKSWPGAKVYREADGTFTLERPGLEALQIGKEFPLAKRALHGMAIIDRAPKKTNADLLSKRPDAIYRYDKDPAHSERLAAGIVYLSTLRRVRAKEGPGSDQEEGRIRRIIDSMRHGNMQIYNSAFTYDLPDGWVYCATMRPNAVCRQRFGNHCVRIEQPLEVFKAVTGLLATEHHFDHPGYHSGIGPVEYQPDHRVGKGRTIGQSDPMPHPLDIGLVKPKDGRGFHNEEEARMLWLPRVIPPGGLAPREVDLSYLPHLRKLFTLMKG